MDRICPHKFDLERDRYYRIRACMEQVPVSEAGTIYSDRFSSECIHVITKTGINNVIRIK